MNPCSSASWTLLIIAQGESRETPAHCTSSHICAASQGDSWATVA
jgi:hypothetical protein